MCQLVLIVPCYNEQEVLPSSHKKLSGLVDDMIRSGHISEKSSICYIDDGSNDSTWEIISDLHQQEKNVLGIKLSRNFGQQKAFMAGLEATSGRYDTYITIDADLQDDISVIPEMIDKYKDGSQIVFGVRSDRKADSWIYRNTAALFYKMMRNFGDSSIYNHAEFRLADKRVVQEFLNYTETNIYLRGIFSSMGFPTAIVYYARKKREAGTSKYPVRKLIGLAWEGISSFSVKPLRIVTVLGFVTLLVSLLLIIWAIVEYSLGNTLRGWFSTIIPITFFGSVQMISLGIIGEYIGKIYGEVKRRPRFIIEKMLEENKKDQE